MKNKAIFLDRDGVINQDYGYVHVKDNFEFIDGIFDVVRTAIEHDYKVIVVTNQAGIGREYYDTKQFQDLTSWMCGEFERRGCFITKVYHSPYHPTKGLGHYKQDHFSRKPNPGMILDAGIDFDIDMRRSILVGDHETDMIAGARAGIGKLILYSCEGISSKNSEQLKDCLVFKSLYEVKDLILSECMK
jgi:D-glycero-D-manno-heptose 1,7-bisphosphate phosphatase